MCHCHLYPGIYVNQGSRKIVMQSRTENFSKHCSASVVTVLCHVAHFPKVSLLSIGGKMLFFTDGLQFFVYTGNMKHYFYSPIYY